MRHYDRSRPVESFQRSELYLCPVPDNRCPGVPQLVSTRSFVIMYKEKIILQILKEKVGNKQKFFSYKILYPDNLNPGITEKDKNKWIWPCPTFPKCFVSS